MDANYAPPKVLQKGMVVIMRFTDLCIQHSTHWTAHLPRPRANLISVVI